MHAPWRPEHLAAASSDVSAKPSALEKRSCECIPCMLKQFPLKCAFHPDRNNPALKGGVYGRLLSWPLKGGAMIPPAPGAPCSGGSATFKRPVKKKCAPFGFAEFVDVEGCSGSS